MEEEEVERGDQLARAGHIFVQGPGALVDGPRAPQLCVPSRMAQLV